MVSTRLSLLQRAQDGDENAWEKISVVYQPMIAWWLRRQNLNAHDAEEIGQEVMLVVVRRLPEFEHSGNVGAFRSWLRAISANQLRTYARKYFNQPQTGAKDFHLLLDALQDDSSELSRQWDHQYNQFVIRGLLAWVTESVETTTVEIFKKLVLEEQAAADIAKEFGTTVGAVYSAKARIMRKMRSAGSDLIDGSFFE